MMNDMDVVEKFDKNFLNITIPIVIYGIGEQTKKILEKYKDKVTYLLDGYKTNGEIYGKEIVSLDSLGGKEVVILIVARRASEKAIYKNIEKFCKCHNIDVYNLDGKLNDDILGNDVTIDYADNIVKREVDSFSTINKYFDLGYKSLAPLLTGFMMWFVNEIKLKSADKILFISRDGFLVKKIYDEIAKKIELPPSDYVYTSRNFALMCSIEDEKDIEYIKKFPYEGTKEELLKKRFYINDEASNNDLIISSAKVYRENYKRYLKKFCITHDTVIFDFVSSGTIQMCLEKILGIKLCGIYFSKVDTYDEKKQNLDIKGFLNDNFEGYDCDNYLLLEPLIKSQDGSLRYLDSDLNAIFETNAEIDKEILEVQKGVEEFIKKLVARDDFFIDLKSINYALYKLINIDKEVDFNITNLDVFTNRKIIM